MKPRLIDFLFILLTVAFTVYGQMIVKWRISALGFLEGQSHNLSSMIPRLLVDPGVLSGLLAGLLAAICWMAALSKFQLSYAYPFTSLSFVLVLLLSAWMLREPVNATRIAGVALIIIGTIVASRS